MSEPKRKPSIKRQALFWVIFFFGVMILVVVGVLTLGLIPFKKLSNRWGIKWD